MRQARAKAKSKAIRKPLWLANLQSFHIKLPKKSELFCAKGPIFWILLFYTVKGTAVTIAALAALYFGFNL